MNKVRYLTLACLAVVMGAGVMGCAKQTGREVDPDVRLRGDAGLQSRDLREMTERMAPDLRSIPELAPGRSTKAVIVMKPIENKTARPGEDLSIYVARLKAILNSNPTIRNDIAFVEERETLNWVRATELDGGGGGAVNNSRVQPQYVLWGTFYEKRAARSSYFLCTFRLTDIKTGVQVWEKPYEVKTLK
ncbi:MAG: hypothetical protein FWD61_11445 [Phycisphaerales bacterium]|nr:hypothetical protein [Phycisphaerales bacterium]